jgi:group I intron endonuclease
MIGIYKITNKTNGKIYIGQSIDIEGRIKDHLYRNYREQDLHGELDREIRRIGPENFEWEILKECTKEELNQYEKEYISNYNSNNPEIGYNIKGGGSPSYNGQERPIIDVQTLETYSSISECANKLNLNIGDISRVCNHLYGQIKGHQFMYLDEYNEKGVVKYIPVENHGKSKTVKCIETDQIFESAHEAGRQMGLNFRLISAVCNGKRNTTGGYHFIYM